MPIALKVILVILGVVFALYVVYLANSLGSHDDYDL